MSALVSGLVLVPSYGLVGSASSFAIGGGVCLFAVCIYAFTHMQELGESDKGSRDMDGGRAPMPGSEHSQRLNGSLSHQQKVASGAAESDRARGAVGRAEGGDAFTRWGRGGRFRGLSGEVAWRAMISLPV